MKFDEIKEVVMLKGKRKFIIAILLSTFALIGFLQMVWYVKSGIEAYGALLAFLGVVVKLYNDANIKTNGNDKHGDSK